MTEVDEPDYELLYQELLYEVCQHVPGETRHQTALRYIQFGERLSRLSDHGRGILYRALGKIEHKRTCDKISKRLVRERRR